MIRQFLKDGIFYSIVSLLSRGTSFLLLPIYTRILSPVDFGIIDMLTLLGIILNLMVAFEIMQGVARFLPETDSEKQKKIILSSALWFTIVMYAFTGLILWLFEKPICLFLMDDLKWIDTYRIAIVSLLLNGVFLFFQNALRWQLKAKQSATISLIYSLTTALVAVSLVAIYDMAVVGIYWGYIAGAVAGSTVGYLLNARPYGFVFSKTVTNKLLRFSLPLVPSSASVFLTLYIDRVIVKEYLGLEDLGIYSIAIKFASMVGLIIVGFNSALTPLIYQEHKNPETPTKIAQITTLYFSASFILVSFFSMLSNEVLFLFTEKDFYKAAPLIPLLTLNMVISYGYIFAPGLSIVKKTKVIAIINIAMGIFNFVLNIQLILLLGIFGAIIATLITTILGFATNVYYSQRNYFISFDKRALWTFLGFSVFIIFCGYQLSNEISFFWTTLRGIIFVLCCILFGLVIGKSKFSSILSSHVPKR